MDSTLNDGHLFDDGLKAYQSKYALNREAPESKGVVRLVIEFGIDCDWNPAVNSMWAMARLNGTNSNALATLGSLGLEHRLMDGTGLAQRLGTDYYTHGVWTAGAAASAG